MLSMLNTYCNLCNSGNCELFLTNRFGNLFKCNNCDFIFALPKTKTVCELYSEGYHRENYINDKYRLGRITQANERACDIKEFLENGKLLDIGCSVGYFLKSANDFGFDAKGVEISDFARDFCQRQGFKVYSGNLTALDLPEGSFDCITMWDFVEHLPDPKVYIKEAWYLLKKNSILALKTPNASLEFFKIIKLLSYFIPQTSYLLHPDKHLVYFTPEVLSKLLESCGFSVLKIKMVDEIKKKNYHKSRIKSFIKRVYFNSIKNYLKLRGFKESFIIFARKL